MSGCVWVGVALFAWRIAARTTSVPLRSSGPQIRPARPGGHLPVGPKTPPTSLLGYWPATRLASRSACIVRSLFFYPKDLQFVGAIEQFGWQIGVLFAEPIEQKCTGGDDHV